MTERVYLTRDIADLPSKTLNSLLLELTPLATDAKEGNGSASLEWLAWLTREGRLSSLFGKKIAGLLVIDNGRLQVVTCLTTLGRTRALDWVGGQMSNNILALYVVQAPRNTIGRVVAVPMYQNEATGLHILFNPHNIIQPFHTNQNFV